MIYLSVVFLLLLCIYIYDIKNKKEKKNESYLFILFLLVFISGFSYRIGSDTINYMIEFDKYGTLNDCSWRYLNSFEGRQPGWVLFVTLSKTICPSFVFFKLLHAFIINSIFLKCIRLNTSNLFMGILFYFIVVYFNVNFEILREALSISIFLISTRYFINNRWLLYYIMVIVAVTFHESALFLLLLPIFKLIGTSRKAMLSYFFIIIACLLSSSMFVSLIINILFVEFLSEKAQYYLGNDSYSLSIFSISNVINYVLNILLPLMAFSYFFDTKKYKYCYFVIAYSFIYAFTLILPIFYRLNNYMVIFYIIMLIDSIKYLLLKYVKCKKVGVMLFITFCFSILFMKIMLYTYPLGSRDIPNYVRYYPYSSVFDCQESAPRELLYRTMGE